MIQAQLMHGGPGWITRNIDRRNDLTDIRLEAHYDWPNWFGNRNGSQDWNVQLSPNLPIDLRVQAGAGGMELDLTDLKVTQMDVKAGAGGLNITFPGAAGSTNARVEAGVGGVELTIPEGVAARIRTHTGLGAATIDQNRFPRNGSYYQSPDYGTATNRLDLDLQAGVGGITIR